MFLRRDFHIKKQLQTNRAEQRSMQVEPEVLTKLKEKALQQLSMSRIRNRQMQFHKIELFLLIAPQKDTAKFYSELKTGLQQIFNDEKMRRVVEQKWSHSLKSNVMGLFNKIAKDFYRYESVRDIFAKLYADTIIRLMKEDRLSRIEEKFLDCFIIETIRLNKSLQVLGNNNFAEIMAVSEKVRVAMLQREVPKSLTNYQFLQYAVMSCLRMQLPHQKYLYNHLVHAPNPKYLLPFRRKGAFVNLTNQILLKLSKVDMIGFRYWSYFDYEESDVYPKIRKASGWEAKSQIMRMLLKEKIKSGLERYMNLINERIKSYSTRQIDDAGINDLMSYVEICLQICDKRDPDEKNFGTALERVDLGQVFQYKNLENDHRVKQCMQKLVQLYLKLLVLCSKKSLKMKFIQKISVIICKLIKGYNEEKFKSDITNTVISVSRRLEQQERTQLIFYAIDNVNREWEKEQERSSSVLVKINPYVVSFIAEMVYQFGFDDANRPECKALKLQFFYILTINYKENEYFESKKKLSMIPIDINHSLSSNQIFGKLQVRRVFQESLRQHLRSVYENYQLDRPEHEGLLAIIDEVVSFRIQVAKENAFRHDFDSFFAVLVSFLEQSERVDPTGKLLITVRNYFLRCVKTYMQDTSRLKFQDSGKKACIELLIKNVRFVTEGTISSNPVISQFCQKILNDYIQLYPQIAFHPQILTVMAECISFLYRKSTQEYQSKAQRLKYKNYVSNILIPTKTKEITQYMIKLMTALYQIILNGHCLNQNYLKFRVLYLIKQNAKTANITFGWKYLKHIINNFKEDKQFIAKEVLNNNSCAWFINEQFFARKVKQMKPQRILLDKYLLPIHNKSCDSADLKKIFLTVQPQMQVQFLITPPEDKQNQIDLIIEDLEDVCQRIEEIHDNDYNVGEETMEQEQNKLYEIVSRIKMAYINNRSASHVLSRMLEVCRKYNNNQLMKYVFLKVVPLLYCMTDNVIKSLIISSETLYYIVRELNSTGNLYLERTHGNASSEPDTFDIKTDYFDQSIREYEKAEDTAMHYQLQKELTDSDDKVKRFMIMRLHNRRMYSLQKMYREIMKYISEHFHAFVAKGIPLMQFAQILKINFLIDPNILQFFPLQSICYSLTVHLQLVNMLKASVEKGEVDYDEAFIDDFYIKTLKIGLYHFQKRKTYYKEELITKNSNIKSLKIKINFFIQICDYLRNDDFHRFRKKRLPKRDQIFRKRNHDDNLLQKILNYTKQRNFDRSDVVSVIQDEQQQQLMNSRQSYINDYEFDTTVLRYCLLYLISEQIDRIKAYSYIELEDIENPYSLSGKKRFINHEHIMKLYDYFGEGSLVLIYNFVKIFGQRIDNPNIIMNKIQEVITRKPDYGFPEFLSIYIDKNKDSKQVIKRINYWKPPNVQILFKYLSQEYQKYPYLQLYVTKVLSRLHAEQILFYLPQIHQTLTLSTGQIVYDFLLEYAKKSASFAHQLIWIAKVESRQERDPHNKNPRLPGVDENLEKLCRASNRLIKDTIRQFTREEKSFFKEVDQFYEQVTAVSGKLNPRWQFAQKKEKIREEVAKIMTPKSVYLPTNPFFQVVGIKLQSGTPMQSAAKCPFLLTFKCKKYVGPDRDFQRRRELKKQNRFVDSDQQIQPIQQEEMPSRLPVSKPAVMGSRVGKLTLSKSIVDSESSELRQSRNVSTPASTHQFKLNNSNNPVNVNDIRISIDQPIESSRKKYKRSSVFNGVQRMGGSSQSPQVEVSCIFKVFDDIRQDSLALQVIQLFMQIFQKNNLDLKLFPYKTISNRTGQNLNIGGIIEVVPKTVSRDSIGKTNEQSLYQFFISNFGAQYNSVFQQARENFIKSQAAYSIISYILQIKDRHNGNILINKEQGYLVHIDFGFIFDISPANNLRFQRADFKLTEEMIKIMGGKIDSQPFQLYMNLVIKGFLIVRKYSEHVYNIVKLMYYSGLPCFLARSLENLESRFVMHLSEIQAAEYMKNIILKAADHWTTNWYDKIQWIQQRIYH